MVSWSKNSLWSIHVVTVSFCTGNLINKQVITVSATAIIVACSMLVQMRCFKLHHCFMFVLASICLCSVGFVLDVFVTVCFMLLVSCWIWTCIAFTTKKNTTEFCVQMRMCIYYVEYGNSNCILDQFGQNFTNANCDVVECYVSANGQVSLFISQ